MDELVSILSVCWKRFQSATVAEHASSSLGALPGHYRSLQLSNSLRTDTSRINQARIRRVILTSGFLVKAVGENGGNDSHQERVEFLSLDSSHRWSLDKVHSVAQVSTPNFGELGLAQPPSN